MILFLAYIIISIIFEWYILKYSSIGTPTHMVQHRNQKVSNVVQWKCKIIILMQLVLLSFGITGICHVNIYYKCIDMKKRNDVAFLFVLLIVIVLQCMYTFMNIIFIIHILRLPKVSSYGHGSARSPLSNNHPRHDYGAVEDMWQRRCDNCCRILSILTCCLFGGKELFTKNNNDTNETTTNGLYSDIARILTDYFEHGGVLDIVPSDVIAGLVMLQREQKIRQYEARREIVSVRSTRSLMYSGSSASLSLKDDDNYIDKTTYNLSSNPYNNQTGRRRQMKYIKHRDSSYSTSASSLNTNASNTNKTKNKSTTRLALNPFLEMDRFIMAEGTRYVRFALAIYTWMLYVYMHPCKGWMRLGCSPCSCCCSSCKKDQSFGSGGDEEQQMKQKFIPPIIVGDNNYNSHRNAFLLHLNANNMDKDINIIYAQFQNGIIETPYAIVIDHKCKSIVVTIRGSLSLEDCVIDAMPDPISLEKVYNNSEHKQYCHSGIYSRTMWIYDNIQEHNLLHHVMQEYDTYILRIVGHSLGAGCAALLSLMYKNTYPNLRCLCYSPPGGLFSYELAIQCSSYTTSFVLDTDLVPRLSVENMEMLRNDVLSIISRISVPKIQILQHLVSGVSSILFSNFTQDINDIEEREESLYNTNAKLLYPKDDIPDSTFTRQYNQFQLIQSDRKRQRLLEFGTKNMKEYIHKISLHPPGKIIHFVKTGEDSMITSNDSDPSMLSTNTKTTTNISRCLRKCVTCGTTNVGSEYSPIYIQNNDLNEILVSPTMGTDHFPDRVCLEIEKVFEKQFCTTLLGDGKDGEIEREIVHLLNIHDSIEKIERLMAE